VPIPKQHAMTWRRHLANLCGRLDSSDAARPPVVRAGDAVRLMLAWSRTDKLDRRDVFFVHMLDPVKKQPAVNQNESAAP
jgi:hypothetical protein